MNGFGRFVRRSFSVQHFQSHEARRHFTSSPMTSFLGRSALASVNKPVSSIYDSPFGKFGALNVGQKRGLKGLCKFKSKSAGRNSQGRITIFHRGGGAKRLQRRIDLKRSTASMGVVERVEYDPNRSARIALVRWTGEMQVPRLRKGDATEEKYTPPHKIIDPNTANIRGVFPFSSLPGMRQMDGNTKKVYPKDVFLSAFASPKANGKINPLPLPRMAVAGSNPGLVGLRMIRKLRGEDGSGLCEVRKCRPSNSVIWAHKIKRKAAVSWQSSRQEETLGLVSGQ